MKKRLALSVGSILLLTALLLLFAWGRRAQSFPCYETAARTPKADYAFKGASRPVDSSTVAFEALKAGVFWIDEFVSHEGIGVVFGSSGRFAVMEPSRSGFPDWDLVASGEWQGSHRDFQFENIKVGETRTVFSK
ncbi:hypothetical protein [Roseibacillus persicicus]|uniref:hypothetical protein n=1 Tax=Roseibacillus persicicus TaxID=454148 RepID=UPI001674895E|nr:hypothetical protein [Roseibacillus persicicus]